MISTTNTNIKCSRQEGAVLLVGLLILLLATLISVAAMNNSNLQERMASNSQSLNRTFQTAQSAVDNRITIIEGTNGTNGDTTMLDQARSQYALATPTWPTATFSLGDTSVATTMSLEYKGDTIAIGSSLSADEGSTQVKAMLFQINVTSTMNNTNAVTNVVQGFAYN